ncbi:MAG: UDP-3-O-acyl-N-acetylglucosamine deacetylase [Paracoccaceae bacterium]
MQRSLKSTVRFDGFGLHSGCRVSLAVHPAAAGFGIWFKRTDVNLVDQLVKADWRNVVQSPLCTQLMNDAGTTVATVEHLMAALAGCGIYNALIEIDGPEVPILDGSSQPLVQGFIAAGIDNLAGNAVSIRILKTVEVRLGQALARLAPSKMLEISFSIDFVDVAIGYQEKTLNMSNGAFVRELSDSRTFCMQQDVDVMHAHGLALGGTLDNAVVFENGKVLSPGGLRHFDEPVRHKMLDALGDLALTGAPVLGRYTGVFAGHALTNSLLRALFDDPSAYEITPVGVSIGNLLPGMGLKVSDIPIHV